MTEFLLDLALIFSLFYLGINLNIIAAALRAKHIPTARNEIESEEEGANEKEPRHQV